MIEVGLFRGTWHDLQNGRTGCGIGFQERGLRKEDESFVEHTGSRSLMSRIAPGWSLAIALAVLVSTGHGQTIERRAAAIGPAGRSVEREVSRSRTPGNISREVVESGPAGRSAQRTATIRRGWVGATREANAEHPDGSMKREVAVERHWTPLPPISSERHEMARGSRVVVDREVVIERAPLFGVAPPVFGFVFGAPASPPPPFVVAAPVPPVVVQRDMNVQPGPPIVVQPEVVVTPPAPAFDPYIDALGRLESKHDNSRRDGALTLGRIGDPRAVPALILLLQNDRDDDVRSAAAYALGAIGDTRAVPALEWSALRDRDGDVRRAASHAYARVPQAVETVTPQSTPLEGRPSPLPSAAVPPPPPPLPMSSDVPAANGDGLHSLPTPAERLQPTGFQPVTPRN